MTGINKSNFRTFDAVVIGASAGGVNAITDVLAQTNRAVSFPIFIAKHVGLDDRGGAVTVFNKLTDRTIVEAWDKQVIEAGCVYIAPSNYHMLVENRKLLCLNTDEKACYVRPSIDVLFQSAADVYGERLLAIILTGANEDGAEGVRSVARGGGYTIAQQPQSAEVDVMPRAAIATGCVDQIMTLGEISHFLNCLVA